VKTKIGILSLGCPRNLVDLEGISGRLFRKGYKIVDIDKAEIAIVNTCVFIKEAKQESIDAILGLIDLKKRGKLRKIIVHGCFPQRYKALLIKQLPEVDVFVGRVSLGGESDRFAITPKHYAYLKICEGCINQCSFCIIPRIKGKFNSLPVKSVLNKANSLSRFGISELNIIGQDITGYGLDLESGISLAKLLRKITKEIKDVEWIRLLYLNPARIDNDLLKIIAGEERICKYIDLPIQHINSRILKLMNRHVSGDEIIKTISRVRKNIPDVALRTSVIVGFPGETDEEFAQLLAFIKVAKFEKLGAFQYSREEGTRAYSFKGQIPEKVKAERFNQVMSLQQEISRSVNKRFIGKTLKVLVDEFKDGSYLGRSEFDAPEVDGLVYINTKSKLNPGDFVKVKITDTLEYDLVGREA
jgi:ribosomal protein S12 methylthiotransferase